MTDIDSVDTLRARYREPVVAWDAERLHDPKKANTIFRRHHVLYKSMRDSVEGQEAITGLLDDPLLAVRLLAATHSLRWASDRAVAVLEEIEQSTSLYGVDAKYTLMEFRNGTLNLDW